MYFVFYVHMCCYFPRFGVKLYLIHSTIVPFHTIRFDIQNINLVYAPL
jgi:hypothetical protein